MCDYLSSSLYFITFYHVNIRYYFYILVYNCNHILHQITFNIKYSVSLNFDERQYTYTINRISLIVMRK